MPDATTTQTIHELIFEGPLGWWWLIPIGLLLFGAAIWLGIRDYRHTQGSRWVPVLVALRLTAIGALLWMIAGPTYISHLRTEKTKSLAVLVDQSASMKLVDPVDESGNNLRWLSSESNSAPILSQLDEVVATLVSVGTSLNAPSPQLNNEETQKRQKAHTEQLQSAAATLPDTLRQLAEPINSSLPGSGEIARRVADQIDTELLPELAAYNPDGQETPQTTSSRLHEALRAASQELENLANRYAAAVETAVPNDLQEKMAAASAQSRADKVQQWLDQANASWMADLRDQGSVTEFGFGNGVTPYQQTSAERTGNETSSEPIFAASTDLSEPLQHVALEHTRSNLEGAIVFTDGGHNSGDDPAQIAAALPDVPLYLVPIGNTKMPRDVILHHTLAPRTVYQNDLVAVETMLTAYRCVGEQLRVQLLADGQVVDQEQFVVRREIFDTRLKLEWKATELGRHAFNVRVVPVSDEKSEENNETELTVHVTEDKIRVLIADNMPRWEFRYLINLFDRDDRVTYEQLIFEPRHSSSGRTPPPPAFPYRFEDWIRYRVIILGDVRPTQLTPEHQQLLHRYVTEFGGNLIVIAGRENMPEAYRNLPLEKLLPVEPADQRIDPRRPYSLSVTPEGSYTTPVQLESTPVTSDRVWRNMTDRLPLYSLSSVSQLKPTGHSLIAAHPADDTAYRAGRPLLSYLSWQYVGRGRVVYLAAPTSYQLRYLKGDRYHHRFWGQLLRWAIARDLTEGSRTVRLATDKVSYEQGDPVQVTAQLYRTDGSRVTGGSPQIAIRQGEDVLQSLALLESPSQPGIYEGTVNGLPTGKITLNLHGDPIPSLLAAEGYQGAIETVINIDPNGALEFRHPLCNLALLHQIAEASNGAVLSPAGLERAISLLDLKPETSETIRRSPIWNQWKYLWLFIGCLGLEWAGRKFLGLV